MRRKQKKRQLYRILILFFLCMGVGYAALTTDLSIDGTSHVPSSSWSIYFDHVVESQGIVTPNTAATISSSLTTVTYNVTLNVPGDFYEFTVDIVNDGTIDAMIDSFSSKLNGTEIGTSNPLPNYMDYSVTYSDGIPIAVNQLLEAGDTETVKVRVEYKRDITGDDVPATNQNNTFSFNVTYVQADGNAISIPHIESFSTDSWEAIIGAIHSGTPVPYQVGDTREIDLGNELGTHVLRIANMSTPSECSTTGFSQTACGFVIEFADIITDYYMNPSGLYHEIMYPWGWNVDGWPASEMRAYLNDTNESTSIINSLPEVLRNAIIDTTVVSGHGPTNGETNFTSTDKLYLLSAHEVWAEDDEYVYSSVASDDTAYNNTRQLDYYAGIDVTEYDFSGAIKQYEGSNTDWWLRSACSSSDNGFFIVSPGGDWVTVISSNYYGVSPAFRLG